VLNALSRCYEYLVTVPVLTASLQSIHATEEGGVRNSQKRGLEHRALCNSILYKCTEKLLYIFGVQAAPLHQRLHGGILGIRQILCNATLSAQCNVCKSGNSQRPHHGPPSSCQHIVTFARVEIHGVPIMCQHLHSQHINACKSGKSGRPHHVPTCSFQHGLFAHNNDRSLSGVHDSFIKVKPPSALNVASHRPLQPPIECMHAGMPAVERRDRKGGEPLAKRGIEDSVSVPQRFFMRPHIKIQTTAAEATLDIEPCLKLRGNLFPAASFHFGKKVRVCCEVVENAFCYGQRGFDRPPNYMT
jgi:hypothetical protein